MMGMTNDPRVKGHVLSLYYSYTKIMNTLVDVAILKKEDVAEFTRWPTQYEVNILASLEVYRKS